MNGKIAFGQGSRIKRNIGAGLGELAQLKRRRMLAATFKSSQRCVKLTTQQVVQAGFNIHALEMALASGVTVELRAEALPLMPRALDYARDGLIPAGSHLNRKHWACSSLIEESVDEALTSLAFDAQTSGGLLLAVPPEQLEQAREMLLAGGDLACEIGEVVEPRPDGAALVLRP